MSQIYVANQANEMPRILSTDFVTSGSVVLNATGETCFMIGQVWLEGGSGSKTISSAGGGSIVWRSGSVTFSNGSTVFDVGIQDISTATAPAQGDGTYDVKASFTGGGGGVTANATQTSVMTTGTKTITHGDFVAIGIAMTTAAGADSVAVTTSATDVTANMPCVTANTGGSYSRQNTAPLVYIVFDDGTKGWLWMTDFHYVNNTSVTYNLDSATADEYGNIIIPKVTYFATGIRATLDINVTANIELILYSDPLGTPVAERTITFDAEMSGTAAVNNGYFMFASGYTMRSNTTYAIAVRPTTTSSISAYYLDTVAGAALLGAPNDNAYACRRIGNSGAFSDYNGGTAKTRLMNMSLVSNYADQGINKGNYHIGI